jgi:Holliday junction DNA helicase RuvA
MIVRLTGTLVEALPTRVVLDVGGVGYELGVSANTAAALPAVGEAGVTLLTRLIVREDAMELYGFSSREERALFDRLVAISGVGPKLALSVLSTFTPQALATVVATQDVSRMSQVPGVGKKKAQRLLVDLEGVFQKDAELRSLVGLTSPADGTVSVKAAGAAPAVSVEAEATDALLSMGFTSQEVELALDGFEEAGANTIQKVLSYALKRLGSGA